MLIIMGILVCLGYIAALVVLGGSIKPTPTKRATLHDSIPEGRRNIETKDNQPD